jgi:hypothetical protein
MRQNIIAINNKKITIRKTNPTVNGRNILNQVKVSYKNP